MGQDDLETVVRDGVRGLHQYIRLLESLLESAKAADTLFRAGHYLVEGMDPGGSEVTSSSHALGFRPGAGSSRTDSEHDEVYQRLEAALRAERLTGHNRVVRALRVIAAANGGQIDFSLTCQLLRDVGVCRGTPQNISSYISRRLRVSDEFERIGEPGSGRYRWLSYQGERMEDTVVDDRESSGSPGIVGGP